MNPLGEYLYPAAATILPMAAYYPSCPPIHDLVECALLIPVLLHVPKLSMAIYAHTGHALAYIAEPLTFLFILGLLTKYSSSWVSQSLLTSANISLVVLMDACRVTQRYLRAQPLMLDFDTAEALQRRVRELELNMVTEFERVLLRLDRLQERYASLTLQINGTLAGSGGENLGPHHGILIPPSHNSERRRHIPTPSLGVYDRMMGLLGRSASPTRSHTNDALA